MDKKLKKAVLNHLLLRLLGCCLLLWLFTLMIVSFRDDQIRELQYKSDLSKYKAELEEYNEIFEDYQQKVCAYYGNISSTGRLIIDVNISTKKTNTENIGNEISYVYKINDQSVSNGGQAYIYLFDQNEVFSEIRDDDPSSDDVGNKSDSVLFTLSQLNDGISMTQDISVHERYGRNAGNTATYRVTYKLQLHNKVSVNTRTGLGEPEYPSVAEPIKPNQSSIKVRWYLGLMYDWVTKIIVIIAACLLMIRIIRKTIFEVAENRKSIEVDCTQDPLAQNNDRWF